MTGLATSPRPQSGCTGEVILTHRRKWGRVGSGFRHPPCGAFKPLSTFEVNRRGGVEPPSPSLFKRLVLSSKPPSIETASKDSTTLRQKVKAGRHPEVGTDCPLVDKGSYSRPTRQLFVFYYQTECQRWSSKERLVFGGGIGCC